MKEEVYVCTHKCAWNKEQAEEMKYICPNCGGELKLLKE